MKKGFLFIMTLLLTISSCSKDDDNANEGQGQNTKEIIVNVDGSSKTFNNIIVDRNGVGVFVTASIGSSLNDIITFNTTVGETGNDSMGNFIYKKNGDNYHAQGTDANLTNIISVSTEGKLIASFSGTVSRYNDSTDSFDIIELNNGTLNINY